jgi:hypothetical protein
VLLPLVMALLYELWFEIAPFALARFSLAPTGGEGWGEGAIPGKVQLQIEIGITRIRNHPNLWMIALPPQTIIIVK